MIAAPPSAPWRIFAESLAVRDRPDASAGEIGELASGDLVETGPVTIHPVTGEEWLGIEAGFVSVTGLHRVHPANVAIEGNLPIGSEIVDRWWGLPITYEPGDLTPIPIHRAIEQGGHIYLLREEPLAALEAMLSAAQADGVAIRLNSAYRSGSYQMNLYQRACARDGNGQRYSARPGHSEHQLGTTVDLTDPAEKFAFTAEFARTPQGMWLEATARHFGFRRSYRDENVALTGYISEPWHWRFVGNGD